MARGREGKAFELGAPYLSAGGGISYFWPRKGDDYPAMFRQRMGELEGYLLLRAKKAADVLGIPSCGEYPYMQRGSYLVTHIGKDGQWVELGAFPANGMAALHNVRGEREMVLGFSLASDLLESLDKRALAPRIAPSQDDADAYTLTYPLPHGTGSLPLQRDPGKWRGWLEQTVAGLRLGSVTRLSLEDTAAEIALGRRRITIENGVCTGYGFRGYDVVRASGLLAKLVDSTQFA